MKKFILISFAAFAALVSCTRELDSPEPGILGTVTFKASIVETKTHLGDKEGTSWPNYWSEGDYICVNGVNSTPLDASFDGKASAEFTVEGVAAPYNAVYPGYLVSDYANGAATLNLPDEQGYVDGSYDPDAYVMVGKTSGEDLAFVPQVAIFSITPTGTGTKIKSVSLTSLGGKKIAGAFTTDFESITAADGAKSTVTVSSSEGIDLGEPWMIVIPAADFTEDGIKIVITDEDGGVMTRTATPSKAYVAGKMYSVSIPYVADPLSLTVEGITSSTAVVCWGTSPAFAYTVNVYSDAGCSTLVDSYAVDAGNACWGGQSPRFCVSGLAAGTTYYVKVVNTDQSVESDVLPFTTEAFTIVEVSSTPAAEGDVLLAEDFSEFRWDCDLIGNGAGWFPTEEARTTSFGTLEIDSFQAAETSNEKQISPQTNAVAASRLAHWAQGANKQMYVHPGYIKLVGQSKVTHIVTPPLDNIPANKYATVEVEVTASAYYSESSGSFTTTNAIVAVQTATDLKELEDNDVNTLDLTSNIQPITLTEKTAWNTYKVTLTGVVKGNRIAFGAASSVTGNSARMNVSDIKVKLITLSDEIPIEASCIGKSSSTLVFSWSATGDSAQDIMKPYMLSLSTDADGDDEVVTYFIEPTIDSETGEPVSAASCWTDKDGNPKATKFVFGGLNPATTYYFHVRETDSGKESARIAATTDAFTVVDPSTVSNAGVGDVILAEDFSEIGWGADEFNVAGGSIPKNSKELFTPTGDLSADEVSYVAYNSTPRRLYGDSKVTSDKRLFDWGFFGNSAVYAFSGYVRVTTTASGSRTHIVSPALAGIPAGQKATIDVTVTSLKNDDSANDVAVFLEDHNSLTRVLDPDQSDNSNFSGSGGKFTGASLSDGYPLEVQYRSWSTKTVRINRVVNTDCLVIGSYQNIDTKNRFCLSDVKVEIVELKVPGQIDEEMDIYDFATLQTFLYKCESGLTMRGNVTADIALSAEQEAEIADLYPIANFDGAIVGGGFTISGLKKPFINVLEGSVSNLTLESALNIADAQNNIGIFAKEAYSPAVLSGCVSKGSVAMTYGETVNGNISVGGMVGYADGVTFTGCENQATVSNSATASVGLMVGGLAGTSDASTFVGCSNSADVSNSGFGTDFSGMPCDISLGGIAGYLKGSNTLTGTATQFNSNSGDITENSTTKYVGIGGIAGMNDGDGTDLAYAKNTGDISYSGNTRTNSYVGGILGCAHAICTMDYASNEGDLVFKSLTISKQVWIGGILGGFNAGNSTTKTAEVTIRGCVNSGMIDISGGSNGSNMAAASNSVTSYSYIGGISGNGDCSAKEYLNCTNSGAIKAYMRLKLRLGGICGYTNRNPAGCVNRGPISVCRYNPESNGGNGDVGGIVGYANIETYTDLTNDANVRTTGSSPNCFTGGLIGHVGDSSKAFLRCKVGSTVADSNDRHMISGAGENAFGSTAAGLFAADGTANAWDFTDCIVKTGTMCQNLEITADNLSDALIGRKHPSSVTNPPVFGTF